MRMPQEDGWMARVDQETPVSNDGAARARRGAMAQAGRKEPPRVERTKGGKAHMDQWKVRHTHKEQAGTGAGRMADSRQVYKDVQINSDKKGRRRWHGQWRRKDGRQ